MGDGGWGGNLEVHGGELQVLGDVVYLGIGGEDVCGDRGEDAALGGGLLLVLGIVGADPHVEDGGVRHGPALRLVAGHRRPIDGGGASYFLFWNFTS